MRKKYAWSVVSSKAFASAPQWLIDKIGALSPKSNAAKSATPTVEWRDLFHNDIGEGKRNDTLTRIVGYLLRRRIDPHVVVEFATAINTAKCAPPLPDDEVRTICDSVARCELRRQGLVR